MKLKLKLKAHHPLLDARVKLLDEKFSCGLTLCFPFHHLQQLQSFFSSINVLSSNQCSSPILMFDSRITQTKRRFTPRLVRNIEHNNFEHFAQIM